MFQQNKKGFWIYVLGTMVSIVAPFLVFGMSNFIGVLMGALSGIVGIVFCAMYAANLKHMS
jgi:ABC-type dipeptide/oligopeptide/nickel transport system permease subunit